MLTMASEKKTFRVPKLDPEKRYKLIVQRGGVVTRPKAVMVRTAKQQIEGVEIPRGMEIWVKTQGEIYAINNEFSSEPNIHIEGWQLQPILKMLVMEKLRNGK